LKSFFKVINKITLHCLISREQAKLHNIVFVFREAAFSMFDRVARWPISEGVGQKKKLMARNTFLANLWPILNNCS
jgi:hypothetical protein